MSQDLFSSASAASGPSGPLAARMRPTSVDEVVGQQHLLAEGSPLRQLLEPASASRGGHAGASPVSLVLWGPPGSGKTTLASLAARAHGRRFVQLSAVTAGVREVRTAIAEATDAKAVQGIDTVLFIDEVHRFSKTQQDALLPAVESGTVTLIAATTENPSFSVIAPLLSRSILLILQPLTDDDVRVALERATVDARGLAGQVELDPDALDHLVRIAGGDARRGLTALDASASLARRESLGEEADPATPATVTLEVVERAALQPAARYDRDGDTHYDVASAFIKSIRGSDSDAALHYLARMLEAGEDPRFIARRLVILASEDIGLADPSALPTAVAGLQAVQFIGMPEARITLGHVVLHLSLAPKSNSAYVAVNSAIADVRAGVVGPIPDELRDGSVAASRATGAGKGYRYPHDEPEGVAAFDYRPEALHGREYYQPVERGAEARLAEVRARIRRLLGR